MVNKLLFYAMIGLFVFLLIGGFLMGFGILTGDAMEKIDKEVAEDVSEGISEKVDKEVVEIADEEVDEESNTDLTKYRSEDIPEACRLPEYQNDAESWKEHLSHHEETWYCLDYYEN